MSAGATANTALAAEPAAANRSASSACAVLGSLAYASNALVRPAVAMSTPMNASQNFVVRSAVVVDGAEVRVVAGCDVVRFVVPLEQPHSSRTARSTVE